MKTLLWVLLWAAVPETAVVVGTDADPDPLRFEVPEAGSLELAVEALGLVRGSGGARLTLGVDGLELTGGRVWILSGERARFGWADRPLEIEAGSSVVLQASPPVIAVAQGSVRLGEVWIGPGQLWSGRLQPGGQGLFASARREWRRNQGVPWQLDAQPVPVTPARSPRADVMWGERELFGHPSQTEALLERALLPVPRVAP
ncbi:MAG: hypothetical protein AAF627_20275 [Myxococcota bacterium]